MLDNCKPTCNAAEEEVHHKAQVQCKQHAMHCTTGAWHTHRWTDDEACSFGVELLTERPYLYQLVQEVAIGFFATYAAAKAAEGQAKS